MKLDLSIYDIMLVCTYVKKKKNVLILPEILDCVSL